MLMSFRPQGEILKSLCMTYYSVCDKVMFKWRPAALFYTGCMHSGVSFFGLLTVDPTR